jgi:hypothetical protein
MDISDPRGLYVNLLIMLFAMVLLLAQDMHMKIDVLEAVHYVQTQII